MTLVLPNPWSRERWNITAQGKFARDHGMALAAVYAHAAGVEIGATHPASKASVAKIERQTRIVNKSVTNITNVIGGGGISGSGAPE